MEVLEIEPIRKKKIVVYLIEKSRFYSQSNGVEILGNILENNEINFVTVDMNGENFKENQFLNISRILKALNIKYYFLNMPEFAYSYFNEEITDIEEQIRELREEYQKMDDKGSFKGLNLKSWIDVLEKKIIEEKNILELKTKPKWIVKKILDLVKNCQYKEIHIIHFAYGRTLAEIIKLMKEIQIEIIIYDFNSFYNLSYLTIKHGVSS